MALWVARLRSLSPVGYGRVDIWGAYPLLHRRRQCSKKRRGKVKMRYVGRESQIYELLTMKKMIVSLLLFIPLNAFADGSVSFKADILPILKKQPLVAQFVTESFSVVSDPEGVRIGDTVIPSLGGARIGPYTMDVVWHSRKGDVPAELTINTKNSFFDKDGNQLTSDLHTAAKVSQEFDSFSLQPRRVLSKSATSGSSNGAAYAGNGGAP